MARYSSSGLTWVHDILKNEYGVAPEDLEWVVTDGDADAALTGGVSAWEGVDPGGPRVARGA